MAITPDQAYKNLIDANRFAEAETTIDRWIEANYTEIMAYGKDYPVPASLTQPERKELENRYSEAGWSCYYHINENNTGWVFNFSRKMSGYDER